MDFRSPAAIGARIGQPFRQLELCSGYDHNWVVEGDPGTLRPAAVLEGAESGIRRDVETTLPGLSRWERRGGVRTPGRGVPGNPVFPGYAEPPGVSPVCPPAWGGLGT